MGVGILEGMNEALKKQINNLVQNKKCKGIRVWENERRIKKTKHSSWSSKLSGSKSSGNSVQTLFGGLQNHADE